MLQPSAYTLQSSLLPRVDQPPQNAAETMIQALARLRAAGLPRLKEIHLLLTGPRTAHAVAFQFFLADTIRDLCSSPGPTLRAYDARHPGVALVWPQAATHAAVLEHRSLTLGAAAVKTYNLNHWAHCTDYVEAIKMVDVVLDWSEQSWTAQMMPTVRRLEYRRTYILVESSIPPAQSWASHWELARDRCKNLEQVVFEDCGYVRRSADGASFVPMEDVPSSVRERDAKALGELRVTIAMAESMKQEPPATVVSA
jgi:hypothetical protein